MVLGMLLGLGLAARLWPQGGDLHFRHGFWGSDAEGQSSNYRELRNLVESLKEGLASGLLRGSE
jgi:hypothetical protein